MTTPKNDRAAILQVIHALKVAGWKPMKITDPETVIIRGQSPQSIADLIVKNYDSAVVDFHKPGEKHFHTQWVYFVLGNDPEEVVCDYTVGSQEFDTIVTEFTENW